MAVDIYAIGGGEIIYQVLSAVTLLLNGNGGILHALVTIGASMAVILVYFLCLAGSVEYILKHWALPLGFMMSFLFVPTTTVWVHDEVSQFHKQLDHVPLGIAQFSSHITRMSKNITSVIEMGFSGPDDLKYHKAGYLFGSDILEKAREFKIVNQNFRENMRNFVGQCVKYDIMLNNKYTFDDLRDSTDLWGLVTSNPSKARGIMWLPIKGGKAQYITCAGAVEKFNQEWQNEINRVAFSLSKKMFSGRAVGHSSLQSNKLVMNVPLANFLKNEFLSNLQSTYSYFGELAYTAEEALKQNVMINALGDAASENSRSAGNPVSYAEMKALMQQNYTFDTIGRLAARMLPILKSILESLIYACFILIIPLCMMPHGYKFLKNWAASLIWVCSWPPVYGILNGIMSMCARSATIAEIGTSGGISIANVNGVAMANADMKVLAGYLALSVPFLCIAIVKGVGAFIHLASQLTGATSSAGSAAAGEVASGNFSAANVSLGNSQMGNVSNLQRNMNSLIGSGGHRVDTGGVMITNDAKGFSTSTFAQDSGPNVPSSNMANIVSAQESVRNQRSIVNSQESRLAETQASRESQGGSISERVSHMKADDIARENNMTAQEGETISNASKNVDAWNKGKGYNSSTSAQGNLSVSGSLGATFGLKTGHGETDKAEETLKSLQAGASISGGLGTKVDASNNRFYGSQESAIDEKTYAESKAIMDGFIKKLAASERNDELTSLSRDYVKTLSEENSLTHNLTESKSKLAQAEQGYQRSVTDSVSVSQNKMEDYVQHMVRGNPDMTKQQAKEMLQRNPGDPRVKDALADVVRANRNYPPSEITAPRFENTDFKFNGKDLENRYDTKQAVLQNKIGKVDGSMNQIRAANKIRRDGINAKTDRGLSSTEGAVESGHADIEAKNKVIQDKVKEQKDKWLITRAKDQLFGGDDD